MSILDSIKQIFTRRDAPSPPPPGSSAKAGAAVTGGDISKPAYEGVLEVDLDPPIREAPKPGESGGGAP